MRDIIVDRLHWMVLVSSSVGKCWLRVPLWVHCLATEEIRFLLPSNTGLGQIKRTMGTVDNNSLVIPLIAFMGWGICTLSYTSRSLSVNKMSEYNKRYMVKLALTQPCTCFLFSDDKYYPTFQHLLQPVHMEQLLLSLHRPHYMVPCTLLSGLDHLLCILSALLRLYSS